MGRAYKHSEDVYHHSEDVQQNKHSEDVKVGEGVLQKEREESVCRGRSVAEGEGGECMSRQECCKRR